MVINLSLILYFLCIVYIISSFFVINLGMYLFGTALIIGCGWFIREMLFSNRDDFAVDITYCKI